MYVIVLSPNQTASWRKEVYHLLPPPFSPPRTFYWCINKTYRLYTQPTSPSVLNSLQYKNMILHKTWFVIFFNTSPPPPPTHTHKWENSNESEIEKKHFVSENSFELCCTTSNNLEPLAISNNGDSNTCIQKPKCFRSNNNHITLSFVSIKTSSCQA